MTCGPASFFPLTYVPLVDFRSRTMILPSLTTILVCFFEMLPLGRQMSFSSTRPMVISSDSKSSRCVAPPFSVRMTLKGISAVSLGLAAYFTRHLNQKQLHTAEAQRSRSFRGELHLQKTKKTSAFSAPPRCA